MRRFLTVGFCLTIACGLLATAARAEEFKSGPQVGDLLGEYMVTKAAGAADDGVKVGEELCYRCQLGNRPVVMIFARQTDGPLVDLLKQLDQVVASNQAKQMASFVSLLGDKPDDLKTQAKALVATNKIEHIAVVVPEENKTGPSDYKIDPKAQITVLIYRHGKVAANHAFGAGGLSDGEIKQIIADTSKILND